VTFITKKNLRKSRPENIRRLADFLKIRDTDQMSDRQLIKFLAWYFSRADKRSRGLTTWW